MRAMLTSAIGSLCHVPYLAESIAQANAVRQPSADTLTKDHQGREQVAEQDQRKGARRRSQAPIVEYHVSTYVA